VSLPFNPSSYSSKEWTEIAFEYITSLLPCLKFEIPLDTMKKFLLSSWVDDQISFYWRARNRNIWKYEIGERICGFFFLLTLAIAAMHAVRFGEPWLPVYIYNMTKAVGIISPAAGASVAGIIVYREYLLNAERYNHMERNLREARKGIERARDMPMMIENLELAKDLMLGEHQDWYVVTRVEKPKI